MRNIVIAVLVGAILGAGSLKALTPKVVADTGTAAATPTLTSEQQAWLGALEWCESRGNPKAINPKDRDNTPSYGLLQFKPSTLTLFAKLYGIATTSKGVMDPATQTAIVTQMIVRGGVDWSAQFPVCSHRLGLPPQSPAVANVRN